MGQSGTLTFYRVATVPDPKSTLTELLHVAMPKGKPLLSRTLVEDREYERYINDDFDETPYEFFNDRLEVVDIPDAYVNGRSLFVSRILSPLGDLIATGVRTNIADTIRGTFVPSEMSITVGFHDLWENAEHDEGYRFARPFLSIGFFGYGSPNDWQAFRAAVFGIPEVRAVKRQLESVTGPLEQCVYWSV